MIELVYCSKAKPGLTREDISNILETAREFNSKNNITGCLLFHNEEFIQVLEGERNVVEELYSNIVKDERHFSAYLIASEEKQDRIFTKWSMAFHEFNREDIERRDFVNNFTSFADLAEKPTDAVELFWGVAKVILED